MTEFELIEQFFSGESGAADVALGIGDDCALLLPPPGEQLAVSADTLVADVHFPVDGDPELIGERALRVAVSDLAAMGAAPRWFTLSLTLPNADPHWVENFAYGLQSAAKSCGITLVGGDTTKGPLTIGVQVMGTLPKGSALVRKGALPGDVVFVSGPLGDAAAALATIKQQWQPAAADISYLLDRYYKPEPQWVLGLALRGLASAAIDISDGLLQDLGHICRASGVGAIIEYERLPLSTAVASCPDASQEISWALSGGDDYHLCFTVPRERLLAFEETMEANGFVPTAIGEIVQGDDVTCLKDGQLVQLAQTGYNHFG